MSLGLRVRQCPRSCKPSAVKNWSPSACSPSLFFGATTARIERLPDILIRSRIPIVLPAPGSATITCQERLCQAERSIAWKRFSNAVSMKISLRKREWVMAVAPLASCERVRYVLDDQVRHPGQPPAVLRLSGSAPRYSLIAQLLPLYECLGIADPIDDLARFDESLRLVAFAHGSGFPLTDATSHELWTVCFSNIFPLDKDVQDAHIAAVVIHTELAAPES